MSRSNQLAGIGVLAGLYYLTAQWGLRVSHVSIFATPVWAPSGISLAALCLGGLGLWPGVALGAFLSNWTTGASLQLAALFAVGNTLEAVISLYLLRLLKFDTSLNRMADVFRLVLVAIAGTTISATIGSLSLFAFNQIALSAYYLTWKTWWTGDLLSDLIVAPFLLVWATTRFSSIRWSLTRTAEMGTLLMMLAAITNIVFARPFYPDFGKIALPYLIFPPLIWAALRFGPQGAVTATLFASLISLAHTLKGLGPFGIHSPEESLFSLQLFMGVMAVTALIFAALAVELSKSREALRQSHEDLEKKVDERTQALTASNALLRESEERFRLLVDSGQDYAIFALDPDGRVATWNRGAERIQGFQANEIIGQHISRFYPPEDIQMGMPDQLLQRAREEERVRIEGWRVRKDGTRIFADIVISAVRDKAGLLKGYAKVTRDITERRRLDERLRRSQEQLMEAQRIAHLGNWEWDIEKNSLTWSDELYRIHGLPPQGFRVLFADVLRYIHPDDRHSVKVTLREAMKTRQSFSTELRIVRGDNEERMLHAYGKVVVDSNGKPVRMVGTAQDITEQRQAERILQLKEEELFQARKLEAIGRLAGGVAHDFNNLITGIVGICQDLKGTFSPGDPRRDEVEEVITASNRAFDVTRQLLAFGRRQVISPRIIDVNATIRDFAKLLHRLIGEDIRLDIHLSESSYVKIDPGNLGQILLNLTLNARDAMPGGGSVVLRTVNVLRSSGSEPAIPHVLLEVSDTGKGMDADTRSHIFEPFFTTKSKEKGTGLGLATVYGIVKQSGGDIQVESQLGHGATFKIYLPREMTSKHTETLPAKPVQHADGHETILVIEDEDIVRRVVVKRLRSAGYTVLEAMDGRQALGLFQQRKTQVNMIVTDVVMPEMNGREVVDRVRLIQPDIAVLYMSGYPEDIITHRGTLDPGIHFIEKSMIQKDLLKKVREVLQENPAASVKQAIS